MKLRSILDQLMKHPQAAVYIPNLDRLWPHLTAVSEHLLSTLLARRHSCLVVVIIMTELTEDVTNETLLNCPLVSSSRKIALIGPNQVSNFLFYLLLFI